MSDHGATVAAAATTTTAATAFKCKQLCNTDAVSGCNQQQRQQQQHQQYEYSSATYTWSSSSSPVSPVPAANWRACIRQTPLDIQACARVSIDMPEREAGKGAGCLLLLLLLLGGQLTRWAVKLTLTLSVILPVNPIYLMENIKTKTACGWNVFP